MTRGWPYQKMAGMNLCRLRDFSLGTIAGFLILLSCGCGSGSPSATNAAKTDSDAFAELKAEAKQGIPKAQCSVGKMIYSGEGVPKDEVEAFYWMRKAAGKGLVEAQAFLGFMCLDCEGPQRDNVEAFRWFNKAAAQGHAPAQYAVGSMYSTGKGTAKDNILAYKWLKLAADQGYQATNMAAFISTLTAAELAKAVELAGSFQISKTTWGDEPSWSCKQPFACEPEICSGTGFFITDDGYLITNHHLVKNAGKVFLVTSAGTIAAEVVKVDVVTDLALLKATGQFTALPIADSRNVKLGSPVMTVGYPMPPVMGYSPKFAKGDVAALADGADNPLRFQISVPIQPGNSGGALLDECGNVVGVVNAKINVETAFESSGQLPENVNYAIKSRCVLSFLESVPEVKLRPINLQEKRVAEIASRAEQSSVLILVYGK